MTDTENEWQCVEQLDMTGMDVDQAQGLVESLASGYAAQGRRVKVVAKSIVEIHVATDA